MKARHAIRRHATTALVAGAAGVLITAAPAFGVDVTEPEGGATPGSLVRIQAADLDAGADVSVSLNEARLVLLRTDGDGSLDSEVALPLDLAEGTYSLTVEGAGLSPSRIGLPVTAAGPGAQPVTQAGRGAALAGVLAAPPGGGSANTTGTTSSVSPSSVAQDGTLTWRVGGYPAGETVYVKIDDGEYRGSGVTQGGDIVASATVGSDGTANGSLTVPSDLAAGTHTLRFLATDSDSKGYTHKSTEFTVTAASSGSTSTPSRTPSANSKTDTKNDSKTGSKTDGSTTSKNTGGTLAKTGGPLLATAGVGALAIGVGGALLRRRARRR